MSETGLSSAELPQECLARVFRCGTRTRFACPYSRGPAQGPLLACVRPALAAQPPPLPPPPQLPGASRPGGCGMHPAVMARRGGAGGAGVGGAVRRGVQPARRLRPRPSGAAQLQSGVRRVARLVRPLRRPRHARASGMAPDRGLGAAALPCGRCVTEVGFGRVCPCVGRWAPSCASWPHSTPTKALQPCRPGATEAQLDEVERQLGSALCPALRVLYRCHDGQELEFDRQVGVPCVGVVRVCRV